MNEYIQKAKEITKTCAGYALANKQKFIVGGVLVALLVLIVSLFVYNNRSKIVYQPPRACDLFSLEEAHKLLGKDVINKVDDPVVSGNTSISRCSYTDRNPDANAMMLAAVAIRSGVNDSGVKTVSDGYFAKKPTSDIEVVTGFGDDAYFNVSLGQLNVLDGRDWYIFSYGAGNSPQANTINDATKLARLVLP